MRWRVTVKRKRNVRKKRERERKVKRYVGICLSPEWHTWKKSAEAEVYNERRKETKRNQKGKWKKESESFRVKNMAFYWLAKILEAWKCFWTWLDPVTLLESCFCKKNNERRRKRGKKTESTKRQFIGIEENPRKKRSRSTTRSIRDESGWRIRERVSYRKVCDEK